MEFKSKSSLQLGGVLTERLTGVIVIRAVPVFIRLLIPTLMRRCSRAADGDEAAAVVPLTALIGADQGKMRVKFRSLDS